MGKATLRVAAAMLLLCVVSGATATPTRDHIWTYYSDATMTTIVGVEYDMCSGKWMTGTKTVHCTLDYGENCSGPPCGPEVESADCGNCGDGIDNDGDGRPDMMDYLCQ